MLCALKCYIEFNATIGKRNDVTRFLKFKVLKYWKFFVVVKFCVITWNTNVRIKKLTKWLVKELKSVSDHQSYSVIN